MLLRAISTVGLSRQLYRDPNTLRILRLRAKRIHPLREICKTNPHYKYYDATGREVVLKGISGKAHSTRYVPSIVYRVNQKDNITDIAIYRRCFVE